MLGGKLATGVMKEVAADRAKFNLVLKSTNDCKDDEAVAQNFFKTCVCRGNAGENRCVA
jgi:hypothetical protein